MTSHTAVVIINGQNKEDPIQALENSYYFSVEVPCNKGFTADLFANTSVGRSPPTKFRVPDLKTDLEIGLHY